MSDAQDPADHHSPDKLKLLELLLRKRGIDLQQAPALRPTEAADRLPSIGQQCLWVLDRLSADSANYKLSHRIGLEGPLNLTTLEQSVNEIVRRHETLRTSFHSVQGELSQTVCPSLALVLPVIDLKHLRESEEQACLLRLKDEQWRQPLEMAEAPLLRLHLVRTGDDHHVLLLTIHLMVADARSTEVFISEIASLYHSFSAGMLSPLPELLIQYADFAAWQRREWQSGRLEPQLTYWRQEFSRFSPARLPTEFPRPVEGYFCGAVEAITLPKDLTERLRPLGRQEHATCSLIVMAAFSLLLSRYTGAQEIIVGTSITNRDFIETESLLGFFSNTLAIKIDLSGNPSFVELLRRVRKTVLRAQAHQDIPFEKLIRELRLHLMGVAPIQVMLKMVDEPFEEIRSGELTIKVPEPAFAPTGCDLSLFVLNKDQDWICWFEYDARLFRADTIGRLSSQFRQALHGIAANPRKSISELQLTSTSGPD